MANETKERDAADATRKRLMGLTSTASVSVNFYREMFGSSVRRLAEELVVKYINQSFGVLLSGAFDEKDKRG